MGPQCLTRARQNRAFLQLQELRTIYPDDILAEMLGIKRVALPFMRQPITVWRSVALLHRLTFFPGIRFTVFDLLTAGEFCEDKRPAPQQVVSKAILVEHNFCDGGGI